jgi:hypothetical protein
MINLYRLAQSDAPQVALIDLPSSRRGEGLLKDRWFTAIIENQVEEMSIAAAFRATAWPALDKWATRPSSAPSEAAFYLMPPAKPGLPVLLLCRWPISVASLSQEAADSLARGRYTMEAFDNLAEAKAWTADLIADLVRKGVSSPPVHGPADSAAK